MVPLRVGDLLVGQDGRTTAGSLGLEVSAIVPLIGGGDTTIARSRLARNHTTTAAPRGTSMRNAPKASVLM